MAQVGRLETDEQVVRLDKPDPTFEGQSNGPLPAAPRFKEDYRSTKRGGQRVYAHIEDGSEIISVEVYKALASRKQQAEAPGPGKAKRNWLGGGKVLSQEEVEQLHEPFLSALTDIAGYVDKAIWMDYPEGVGYDIWGDLQPDEVEVLGEFLLKLGQRSPQVAGAVRAAVAWQDYAAIIAIVAPRAQETVKVRKAAPKRAKPRINVSLFRKAAAS